ncbi:BlaI/MecI/CopY family transcriptional regulator [Alteromonadaceae bacterium M269]|nr:BlaI/MecI/CopY family transcriptional regulator [Alteromonadaceae bacterium M269]
MKNIPDISDSEFDVLQALWADNPATAQQVVEYLNRTKVWHEKTVKTLLNRLVKKEAVSFEKVNRYYLYTPLVEQEAYTKAKGESFIQRMFNGKLSPLVANFADDNNLQEEDIHQLKKLIEQWEKDND